MNALQLPEYIHAVHDTDGVHLMDGYPGWVVITEAIGHDPNNRGRRDYSEYKRRGLGVVVRINNAHDGENGTIPLPEFYGDFAQCCANFVAGSTGIDIVVLGNEPNLEGERPKVNGVRHEIKAKDYARCYLICRAAIKRVRGDLPVWVAAVAPFNDQSGDCIVYLRDIAGVVFGQCDGFALHAYTHGADPALVYSDEKEPQYGWYWHFRTYRDQIYAIFAVFGRDIARLGFGITETDQNDPWRDEDSGWVQNTYIEIDNWNLDIEEDQHDCAAIIRFVAQYRSNRDDRWSFADKEGVKRDFRKAVERGYKAPPFSPPVSTPQGNSPQQEALRLPSVKAPPASPSLPPREIDPRAQKRGTAIQTPMVQPGQQFWRVSRLYTPNEAESNKLGPNRHILTNVLVNGARQVGVPLLVTWGNGGPEERATIYTKDNPGYAFSGDHALTPGDWTLEVADGKPSERVINIKMGAFDAEGKWNPGAHTSTLAEWTLETMPVTSAPLPAQPPVKAPQQPPVPNYDPGQRPYHPLGDGPKRITQYFGERPDFYKQFIYDGVPLRGHNGIDFGVIEGTAIYAYDAGKVVEAFDDGPLGWGLIIKLLHPWGETIYAHLRHMLVKVGDVVQPGDLIAYSGNTGLSSGPHLHFGMRVFPYQRGDGWGGYTDPLPHLKNAATGQAPAPIPPSYAGNLVEIFKKVGEEFDLPWTLLASQAWAESSFDPKEISSTGAQGLFMFMPDTWAEWSPKINAGNDPFDPYQSARMAAVYLKWLLPLTENNLYQALIAYGWGIGHWQSDKPRPAIWVEYSNKVMHGHDLLQAVLPLLGGK